MEQLNSNSQFLFSVQKYDEEKRFSIVLTLRSAEEAVSTSIGIDEIRYKLNTYYKEKCADTHPYHYILTTDGKCHNIKDSILSASNIGCELQEYKDDVRVLIMADRMGVLTEAQEETLVQILAEESKKYALLLSDTVYFQNPLLDYTSDIDKYEEVIQRAILKRNNEDSMFCVLEHVIENQIVINEKIRALPPLTNEFGLSDIAIRYNVPISILENLNPHITESNSQDIVFIPNVKTLEYKHESLKIYKKMFAKIYNIKKVLEAINNGL